LVAAGIALLVAFALIENPFSALLLPLAALIYLGATVVLLV
jgi:hypothetical protein